MSSQKTSLHLQCQRSQNQLKGQIVVHDCQRQAIIIIPSEMETASEAAEDGLCSVETAAGLLVAALDSNTPLTKV